MDLITKKKQERRKRHFQRLEENRVERLIKKYRKTKSTGLANYLHSNFGIGDFDVSPDGEINR